jgi:type I restriction enzyme M protein
MAIRKSEIYSSLWASCDELRGSMDASQYKDYVLVMLFMKYVSDRKDPLIDIPEGASFYDMVKLKGQADIGDKMNKIIGEFAKANGLSNIFVADFNDDEKLGKGKDKVDKLSNLITIFEKPELNFSGNRAEGDDLLGDAYEYLMRHFATESGKSKGQFYTPAEVSRVMAKVIGISQSQSQSDSIYDPTCGSGSLLLKVADEAPHGITIYGQENDNATRALAVMNMWLHGYSDAEIEQGNTLASPQFTDDATGELKTFDFAVANPPFSYKSWMNGLENPKEDVYGRFDIVMTVPPKKNGDFAFLLHLLKSLKSKGKACIVLPLGVLFRGNAEADIRRTIIKKGYIKGIIGLPPNLFYGAGIAACLIVIDKEESDKREDIFMIDASRGFIKDGNKNRLREQDIHKIVDTFNNRLEIPKYSRKIPIAEISDAKNDFNLNIPRYIDSSEAEDIQDIEAHLLGGIPKRDVDALENYWSVYPSLKNELFKCRNTHEVSVLEVDERPYSVRASANECGNTHEVSVSKCGNTHEVSVSKTERPYSVRASAFYELTVANEEIKNTIFHHPEFTAFGEQMNRVFEQWKAETLQHCRNLDKDIKPKHEIHVISENLLKFYDNRRLTDKYSMYQHLMDYWADVMQDDFYELADAGWIAGNEVKRIEKKTKKGDKEIVKQVLGIEGLEGRLIPPTLIIQVYFAREQAEIDDLQATAENLAAQMDELREEHGTEDGLLANAVDDKGKITKKTLDRAIKDARLSADAEDELEMLRKYKQLLDDEAETKTKITSAKFELEKKVIQKYPSLSLEEIKHIVIEKKWMHNIESRLSGEMDNISHRLTGRIKELAERYETPLPQLTDSVKDLEKTVNGHLEKMGFAWKIAEARTE